MKDIRTPQLQDSDELISIFDELREKVGTHAVIVEGLKDLESLDRLGIHGNVIHLNIGKSMIDFCNLLSIHYNEVIILTDWDAKGNTLCRLLKQNLKACDVPYDTRLRGRLAALFKKEIKDVQSIFRFLERNYPDILPQVRGDPKPSETQMHQPQDSKQLKEEA